MLLGMGVVFALLSLLVLALKGMSRLAGWLETPSLVSETAGVVSAAGNENPELIAVVTAAIQAHRKDSN